SHLNPREKRKLIEAHRSSQLEGKIAVVTGGNRGIGTAIARKLALLGAHVVICGRHKQELETVAGKINSDGGKCEALVCDLTDLVSVERLAQSVRNNQERIDILVNNAGVGGFNAPLHELSPEKWDQVINTNLRGVFYTIRAFAPMMIERGGGDIVNISSI